MKNKNHLAIVTDSACDIPQELAHEYHIHIIPNILILDDKSYEDGNNISRTEFYERLPGLQTQPQTASPSLGAFQNTYEALLAQGASQIISIHIPYKLSGICSTASAAAQSFGSRVTVIDSGQISLGLGFQALAAAESARSGNSLETTLAFIQSTRSRLKVVAMLDTLEYVRRSGRVSWVRARLGNLLEIKPILELNNGQVYSVGQARTRRKGLQRLQAMVQACMPLERLAILHTNAEADAHYLAENLNMPLALDPLIVNVTTIIGTHVGPNGLGFAIVHAANEDHHLLVK